MKEQLEQFIEYMKTIDVWDEEREMSIFKGTEFMEEDSEVCRCTSGAMIVAERFGGKVFGYHIPDNSSPLLVAVDCGGHDFAIVDNFLIDYWAQEVECTGKALYNLDDPQDLQEVAKKYLPRDQWIELELWPIKSLAV